MKLIPSDNLLKHLIEQNVTMPLGGFDIPDTAYADIDYDLRRHPIHSGESQVEIKDRVDYAAIWRFHGVAQNSGATGQALETVQKTASLTRQIVEMADTHLPNVAEKVSAAIDDSKNVVHAAVSELKSVTHLGQQDIVQAVSDLKMFSAESHAEVLKVRGDLHADLMELLGKLHHLGKWFLGVLIAGILFLCAIGIASMILGIHAHAQSVVIIGAQKGTTNSGAVTASDVDANHKALDVSIVAGGGTGGGPADTAPSATASESDVARQKVTSALRLWDQTAGAGAQMVTWRGDLTSGAWVNCKSGCAGGSTTPTNAFANPTTAGLSMSFNAMWNGSTWDLVKGDTTNGLWVNCKTGCAGGSSTPADTFANPTTAGLQMTFGMVWNGTSWDRQYGDKTNGAFVNIKNSVALTLGAGSAVIGHVIADSGSTTAVTQATGTNLHAVIDTGSTTAVTQATGTNLHAVIDTGSTTSVTQATGTNLHAVTDTGSVTAASNFPTTVDTNSGVKSASTLRVVLATDQPALTNKLLVTPDSVALPANQSVNVSQVNGVTPLMGNGVTGTGSQRVTIASDNTAFAVNATLSAETTKVIGTVNVAAAQTIAVTNATAANLKVDLSGTSANATAIKVDGSAVTQPVSIAANVATTDAASSATGAAPPAKAGFVGFLGSGATGGFLTGAPVGDTYKNINVSTATTTLLVTGVSGRQVRISSIHMVTAAANNVALIEGTGATCGTGSAGMAGGTTAASGYNFAANGGMTLGSGMGSVMQTATTGDSVCIVTSAATQLSGGLQYTIY